MLAASYTTSFSNNCLFEKCIASKSGYVSNIPNMSAEEMAYDLGYGTVEIIKGAATTKGLGLVGSATGKISILSRPLQIRSAGQTTFQLGLRHKSTNFMIRLERKGANRVGGGRIYYTHFNTFPRTRLNHFGVNPFKWGKVIK